MAQKDDKIKEIIRELAAQFFSRESNRTSMITVTGGDGADPISGSNWIVDNVTVRKANTDAVKVSLKMTRFGGVTQ